MSTPKPIAYKPIKDTPMPVRIVLVIAGMLLSLFYWLPIPTGPSCGRVRRSVEHMSVAGYVSETALYDLGLSYPKLGKGANVPGGKVDELFQLLTRNQRLRLFKYALQEYNSSAYACVADMTIAKE